MAIVALPQPTMAGTLNSLATMEAWLVLPPLSVTIAAARFKTGSQSGLVNSVTSISPGSKLVPSEGDLSIRAFPLLIFVPMASPWHMGTGCPSTHNYFIFSGSTCDFTVSGRACMIKISFVMPSLAHSESIGFL